MWRRPVITIVLLIITVILASTLGARQKNVGPSSAGPRPNAVRPYVACSAAMPALPPRAQQKPFTQEQVVSMVRDGFGDESGAKLIEQRGIDFAPSEDFIQTLKAAGASEAFLKGLRLNPNYANAHYGLGIALEFKSDVRGALQEYRSAYELDSKSSSFRKAYERVLQQVNQ